MGLLKPDFDREGNRKVGILWWLLTLGSGSASGGALRAAILAGISVMLKMYLGGK